MWWESISVAVLGSITAILAKAYKAKKYEHAAHLAVIRLLTSQADLVRTRDTIDSEADPDQIRSQLNGIMRETHHTLVAVETSLPKLVNELRGKLSETPDHGN